MRLSKHELLIELELTHDTEPILTPEGHEDGEENRGLVIKEIHDLGVLARLVEVPVVAEVIASRTNDDIGGGANVLTDGETQDAKNK